MAEQPPRALTLDEQVYEIRREFTDEAEAFRLARSGIERQITLNHINALLDCYLDIRVVPVVEHDYD